MVKIWGSRVTEQNKEISTGVSFLGICWQSPAFPLYASTCSCQEPKPWPVTEFDLPENGRFFPLKRKLYPNKINKPKK